jgi:hypothetical protein
MLIWTVILALVLTLSGNAAAARCRDHSIRTPDGRTIYCTTCCDRRGNCDTTCWGG